ncbi:MAG: uracil-DNA glycosylase [Planctomycetota bacterium]
MNAKQLKKRIELERLFGVDVLMAPREGPSPDVTEGLEEVEREVMSCTRCDLHRTRTQGVLHRGDPNAELMFIGEAPGAEEDRRGEPFVGPAGQLLDRMIFAMGLGRDEVYVTNILKSRPPGNRDPRAGEIEACRPYLERQIDLVQPRVICTLGRPAGNTMLESNRSMGSMRGRWHEYRGIPLMPVYHPAYLLRSPSQKAKTWRDLKKIVIALAENT